MRRVCSVPIRNESTPILAVDVFEDNDRCFFIGDLDIDGDGSGGNPSGDPYFQPDTTYHHNGKALNSFNVPWIVLPPIILQRVRPPVLGCWAQVTDLISGRSVTGLVGDIGPRMKVGEVSICLASRLGINADPITGGSEDYNRFLYEFKPGVPAFIDGFAYSLQPLR